MADVLSETLTVMVGDDEFTFKIPTPREQNRVKVRAAALRRQDDPTSMGWEEGLDWLTVDSYRGMATMEVLLKKSSTTWAFSPGENGTMVCDSSKFPISCSTEFFQEVWQGFNKSLETFRKRGTGDGESAGSEAVAG